MLISEADTKNDLTSLDRKLDQKLVLFVKQKLGDKNYWVMPQRPRREGESMRQVGSKLVLATAPMVEKCMNINYISFRFVNMTAFFVNPAVSNGTCLVMLMLEDKILIHVYLATVSICKI